MIESNEFGLPNRDPPVPKFLSSPANAGNDLDEQDISQENLDGNRQNYQNGMFAFCSPDAPLYRNDRINIAQATRASGFSLQIPRLWFDC